MCLQLLHIFDCCGIFTPYELPSFADSEVSMDHSYDTELRELFQKITFCQSLVASNPSPELEKSVYASCSLSGTGSMMQYNALLLSRVFIRNAKAAQLAASFDQHRVIKILDIGCGNALSLMGICVYFGFERLQYTGIDIDAQKIEKCQETYGQFTNASFFCCDATSLTSVASYDLVLLQHPNIFYQKEIFKQIFCRATDFLQQGGKLYATFYYKEEVRYFRKKILPHMHVQGTIQKNACYSEPILDTDTNKTYCPENYSFISEPLSFFSRP